MLVCPLHKPVAVREYVRFRMGQWQLIAAHCRRWPRQ
jgi:hypothetical protein